MSIKKPKPSVPDPDPELEEMSQEDYEKVMAAIGVDVTGPHILELIALEDPTSGLITFTFPSPQLQQTDEKK